MAASEVKVPDIGDFKNVEVIEVLVKPGDKVAKEQSLVTLESDKATMEIPSPAAGTVKELRIKLGEKLSEGSVILVLESSEKTSSEKAEKPKTEPPPAAPSPLDRGATSADLEGDGLVLGPGGGGYSAAFRAADLGLKVVVGERCPTLWGGGLNGGC